MNIFMLNTGYGTDIPIHKIKAVTGFDSVRNKKEVARLKETSNPLLIDSTKHKPIKTVIILDDGTHVLCSMSQEALIRRLSHITGGNNE